MGRFGGEFRSLRFLEYFGDVCGGRFGRFWFLIVK